MTTGLPRLSECRDCHDPIRFVQMEATGRALPVNPQPRPEQTGHGTVVARSVGGRLLGFVVSRDRLGGPGYPYRFLPHHATCEARAIKSTTTAPPTEPHPALF